MCSNNLGKRLKDNCGGNKLHEQLIPGSSHHLAVTTIVQCIFKSADVNTLVLSMRIEVLRLRQQWQSRERPDFCILDSPRECLHLYKPSEKQWTSFAVRGVLSAWSAFLHQKWVLKNILQLNITGIFC